MSIKKEWLKENVPYVPDWKVFSLLDNGKAKLMNFLVDAEDNPKLNRDSEGYIECAIQGFLDENTGLSRNTLIKLLEQLSTVDGYIKTKKGIRGIVFVKIDKTAVNALKDRVMQMSKLTNEEDGNVKVDDKCSKLTDGESSNLTNEDEMSKLTNDEMSNLTDESSKLTVESSNLNTSNNNNNLQEQSTTSTSISNPLQKEEPIKENIPLHSEGIKETNIPIQSEGSFTGEGNVGVPPTPKGATLKEQVYSGAFTTPEGILLTESEFPTFFKDLKDYALDSFGKAVVEPWAVPVDEWNRLPHSCKLKEIAGKGKILTEYDFYDKPKDELLFEALKNPEKGSEYEVIHNWKVFYKSTVPAVSIYNWCKVFTTAVLHGYYKKNNNFEPTPDTAMFWYEEDAKDYFCLVGTPKDQLKGLITEYVKRIGPTFTPVLNDKSLDWYLTCYTRHSKAA